MPEGKPLNETMQENCNARLAPPVKPCPNPCVPYWQPTGNRRCLDIGVVEIEEADGCGHLRFTRVTDPVVWTRSEEIRCDEPRNRIERQEVNQCGGTRWVTTAELCCTPVWVPSGDEEIDCSQSMERRWEEDGCGNTRLRPTGFPVNWASTGEVRCEPGNIYQVEQVNQCGDTRWITIPGGCPCIPDWQPTGQQRCNSVYIENQEEDGCGHTRYTPTEVEVEWMNTGETRCAPIGFIQNQQISQCGTTRWFTTETPCSIAQPPDEVENPEIDTCLSNSGVGAWRQMAVNLNASTGEISWTDTHGDDEASFPGSESGSAPWITGGFNRGDYEAKISYTATQLEDSRRTRSGSTPDTWFNLGDVTNVTMILRCSAVINESQAWDSINVRVDIRRVNESIEGGMDLGPFNFRINVSC